MDNNSENSFKRVSGVIMDHDRSFQRTGLGDIYISDNASSVSNFETQNFIKKVSYIKNNSDRSDILIKLHAKSLSNNT